jgi:hypothetical protein
VSVLYNKVVSECPYSTHKLFPSIVYLCRYYIWMSVLYIKIQTLGYNLVVQYRHSDTTLLYYTDTRIQPCCTIQTLGYNLIVQYRHSDTTLLYNTDTRIQPYCTIQTLGYYTIRLYLSVCNIQQGCIRVSVLYNKVVSECPYSTHKLFPSIVYLCRYYIWMSVLYIRVRTVFEI